MDEREWLRQADHTASRDFDKAVMTLAGGALGVSMVFVRDIVSDHPVHVWWLGTAWVLLALSLALILVAFLTSSSGWRREMRALAGQKPFDKKPGGWPSVLTAILNWTSAGSLVVGIVFLAAFALVNIGRR